MRRMPQLYRNGELVIVIDCSDLARSARFWAGVLGFTTGRVTGGPYRSLVPQGGEGIEVLLQQVREEKRQKNRLHLDLRTADMSTEVRRVLGPRCDPDNRSGCHRRRLAHSRRPRRRRLLRAAADRRSASRLLGGCQPGKGRFDCVKA